MLPQCPCANQSTTRFASESSPVMSKSPLRCGLRNRTSQCCEGENPRRTVRKQRPAACSEVRLAETSAGLGGISASLGTAVERSKYLRLNGGEGGIRTPGRVSPTPVFKTGAINHSATSPLLQFYYSLTTVSLQSPCNSLNQKRSTTAYSGFQDRLFQPLTHPSA